MITLNAVASMQEEAMIPTCCRRQDIRGVPQSHEIKLVKPPVLLVGRGHRVLAPLVDDLVSRVTVWKWKGQSKKAGGQRILLRLKGSVKQAGFIVIPWIAQKLS